MATILEFRASIETPPSRGRASRRSRRGRSAEIVVFPGVRYERWQDGERKPETTASNASRDFLKLVE